MQIPHQLFIIFGFLCDIEPGTDNGGKFMLSQCSEFFTLAQFYLRNCERRMVTIWLKISNAIRDRGLKMRFILNCVTVTSWQIIRKESASNCTLVFSVYFLPAFPLNTIGEIGLYWTETITFLGTFLYWIYLEIATGRLENN